MPTTEEVQTCLVSPHIWEVARYNGVGGERNKGNDVIYRQTWRAVHKTQRAVHKTQTTKAIGKRGERFIRLKERFTRLNEATDRIYSC